MHHTFPKAERLSGKKQIDRLFEKGSTSTESFYLFPFRTILIRRPGVARNNPPDLADAGVPVVAVPADGRAIEEAQWPAILITVPKRAFRHAVDRNHIRRRVREAYRLNKHLILTGDALPPASIAFLYTAKTKISFEDIEKGMKLALRKIGKL